MPNVTGSFLPQSVVNLFFISAAAAFVNVITSISEGLTWQLSIRYFTLPVKTVVLPLPGPAKTRHAPLLTGWFLNLRKLKA